MQGPDKTPSSHRLLRSVQLPGCGCIGNSSVVLLEAALCPRIRCRCLLIACSATAALQTCWQLAHAATA